MTEKEKLILALQQVDNLVNLIEDNEYSKFLHSRLISVQIELERQLANLIHKEKNVRS